MKLRDFADVLFGRTPEDPAVKAHRARRVEAAERGQVEVHREVHTASSALVMATQNVARELARQRRRR